MGGIPSAGLDTVRVANTRDVLGRSTMSSGRWLVLSGRTYGREGAQPRTYFSLGRTPRPLHARTWNPHRRGRADLFSQPDTLETTRNKDLEKVPERAPRGDVDLHLALIPLLLARSSGSLWAVAHEPRANTWHKIQQRLNAGILSVLRNAVSMFGLAFTLLTLLP